MIARIKTQNGFYDSVVFALFKKGWNSSVIVFNQNINALKSIKMWKPKRKVFIYNETQGEEWVVAENVEGYKWVLDNISKKLFRTVIDQKILPKCHELQSTVEQSEWLEIKNDTDISGLMTCALCFHDSYVKKMYTEFGKQYILFDTTWGHDVLFELEGNIETNLSDEKGIGNSDKGLFFLDSEISIRDGLIRWSSNDFDEWGNNNSINIVEYYFCANSVKWKLIVH